MNEIDKLTKAMKATGAAFVPNKIEVRPMLMALSVLRELARSEYGPTNRDDVAAFLELTANDDGGKFVSLGIDSIGFYQS